MATASLQQTVHRLARLLEPVQVQQTDKELLQVFALTGDQDAFAEILRRHGILVRGVCRRVLGDQPSVDDAWQATFIILMRKAHRLVRGGSLASWLHGVAYRTALNERRASLRRRNYEAQVPASTEATPERQLVFREIQALIDAEVQRLPQHLREVFIRCCLENAASTEVASQLGINPGTVRSRLCQARKVLQERLTHKGITLSAALSILALTDTLVPASSINAVVTRTISPSVAALIDAKKMGWFKYTLALGLMTASLLGLSFGQFNEQPTTPPVAKKELLEPSVKSKEEPGEPLPAGALARFGTTLFRTGYHVAGLAFSPDGKRIASWGNNMYNHDGVTIWDAETGRELQATKTGTDTVLRVVWLDNERGVVFIGPTNCTRGPYSEALLRTLEFDSKTPPDLPKQSGGFDFLPLDQRKRLITDLSLSLDAKQIAVLFTNPGDSKFCELARYEFKPGIAFKAWKSLQTYAVPKIPCKAIVLTPDQKLLVGISPLEKTDQKAEAGLITVWDAAGKILHTFETPDGAMQWGNFALTASNHTVGVGLASGATWIADLRTGKGRILQTEHSAKSNNRGSGTLALSFSPDGKNLATGGMNQTIRLTELEAGKGLLTGQHHSTVQVVTFSPDGKRFASSGQDGVVRVWDVGQRKEVVSTPGHGGTIWHVSISADGQRAVTDGGDESIRVWDSATGKQIVKISTDVYVRFSRITNDGKQVFAILGDFTQLQRSLKVFDATTGADVTPERFKKEMTASGFAWTPDGKTLLTYDEDKLAAWEWTTGKQLWTAEMPKPAKPQGINQIEYLTIAPDGETFITIASRHWHREEKGLKFGYAADGVVDYFDLKTGKRIKRLIESDGSTFRAGTYSADGMFIHSGGGMLVTDKPGGKPRPLSNQLCVIDPLTGRFKYDFSPSGRVEGVNSGHGIALSGDGRMLFRTTTHEVQVYEVVTGKFRTAFQGHRDTIFSIAAPSRNVRRVVSGSLDTSALLWDVGFNGKQEKTYSVEDRAFLWEEMGDINADKAYDAMKKWTKNPDGFITHVASVVKPTSIVPKAEDIEKIFRNMDSATFATREKAAAALEKYGESALEMVRKELEKTSSAEVRERLMRFVEKHNPSIPTQEWLVTVRALELLEHLGTDKANELLRKYATGGPSRLTREAKSAVQRIDGK